MKTETEKARQRPRHLEDRLQMSCVRWFDFQHHPLRLLLHHSPNEGLLVKKQTDGAKRKAMGVRAGFPDLILLKPNARYHYMAIELKTDKGRQSDTQREYQRAVEAAGGRYVIVRSIDDFIKEVDGYLET